jgi:hypothetical protein
VPTSSVTEEGLGSLEAQERNVRIASMVHKITKIDSD